MGGRGPRNGEGFPKRRSLDGSRKTAGTIRCGASRLGLALFFFGLNHRMRFFKLLSSSGDKRFSWSSRSAKPTFFTRMQLILVNLIGVDLTPEMEPAPLALRPKLHPTNSLQKPYLSSTCVKFQCTDGFFSIGTLKKAKLRRHGKCSCPFYRRFLRLCRVESRV